MIEIKTQAEFNNLATTIVNTPSTGELIRIYTLANDVAYTMTTALNIRRSNVIIEGVGKPKIKLNTTETTSPNGNIINIMGWGGTAQGGANTTITLASSHTEADSYFIGYEIAIISGTGKGQVRKITGYVSSTKVATVPTWTTNPDSTSVYSIILSNVSIRNLELTGDRYHTGGATGYYGIYIAYCGYAQTARTTGTYSQYDTSTNGITKLNRNGIRIENCTIQNCSNTGILQNRSYSSYITNNVIQSNGSHGMYLNSLNLNTTIANNNIKNNAGNGIYLAYSSNNNMVGNIINNNTYSGINLYTNCISNIIANNSIQNNSYHGITLYSSSNHNTIVNNNLINNSLEGITLTSNSNNNAIMSNAVQNNVNNGIYISGSSYNSISSNIVSNNGSIGIYVDTSDNNSVTNNISQNNYYCGISLISADKNSICNNQTNSNNTTGIILTNAGNDYNNIYGNVSLTNTTAQYSSGGGTDNIATSAVNSW